MHRIIEFDTVRIVTLRGRAEDHLAISQAVRVPCVGESGTVVHLTPTWDPDDPSTRFIVESVDADGSLIWLAEFARDEIEWVPPGAQG